MNRQDKFIKVGKFALFFKENLSSLHDLFSELKWNLQVQQKEEMSNEKAWKFHVLFSLLFNFIAYFPSQLLLFSLHDQRTTYFQGCDISYFIFSHSPSHIFI